MSYFCCDQETRKELAKRCGLNGVDFIEVLTYPDVPEKDSQRFLKVHLLEPVDDSISISGENMQIEGGERIRDLVVLPAHSPIESSADTRIIEVDRPGDFSTYTLRLVRSDKDPRPPEGFDPILSAIKFSFKAGCPSDLDCSKGAICSTEGVFKPDINYLARDYASIRQVLMDRIATLVPEWKERNASDLGIALVEILAYIGDHLSYSQDAIATEAYLGTARRRVSVRRHARLVDYFMHDGSNSRTWVHIDLKEGQLSLDIKLGEIKFLTRMLDLPLNPPFISQEELPVALSHNPEVFEPMHNITLLIEHNRLHFHSWGSNHCCLAKGSTSATLRGRYRHLNEGDVLIFMEVKGPKSGREEDADPEHRHAVRLTKVSFDEMDDLGNIIPLRDPAVINEELGEPQLITEIEWDESDALPFPLCISTPESEDVSMALGNNLLVDHGQTIISDRQPTKEEAELMQDSLDELGLTEENLEYLGTMPGPRIFGLPIKEADVCAESNPLPVPARFRPRLTKGPLTQAAGKISRDRSRIDAFDPGGPASFAMIWEMRDVIASIVILDDEGIIWSPRRDLLLRDDKRNIFVAEVEDDGIAAIRFGDGTFGSRPGEGRKLYASYRIGNGTRGNIGADSLAYAVTDLQGIETISNPLPARGGREPEGIEDVRARAPFAFRSQERAVTPQDYENIAQKYPGVQKAAATFRWTGSWNTIFLTVDRLGGERIDPEFEAGLRSYLERYRLTGHDLEIDDPQAVPLEIEMQISVDPGYSRSLVKEALMEIFSNRSLPDGRQGLFHPDRFTFGQSVFLSPLYKEAQALPGVATVRITKFQRQGVPSNEALNSGELKMSRLEIARLDNDPNFADRGTLLITMEGGRW